MGKTGFEVIREGAREGGMGVKRRLISFFL